MFFKESGKSLLVCDNGLIQIVTDFTTDNGRKRRHRDDITSLSSGEKQILALIGLLIFTPSNVRPEVLINTKEENPTENGEIDAPILIIDKITSKLESIIKDHKKVVLNTHPFVAAYLTKGFPSLRSKWFFEHKKWVKIIPRDAYTYLEYHFFDQEGNEIS